MMVRRQRYDFSLLEGVVQVNKEQHERMVTKMTDLVGGSLHGVTVACWGLTFKANTDDLRDSPAIAFVRRLLEEGAIVRAYDPAAGERAGELVAGLEIFADPYEVCEGARALAVLTEWDEFRWMDFNRVAEMLQTPTVLDTRNLLDPAALRRQGYVYEGVGR